MVGGGTAAGDRGAPPGGSPAQVLRVFRFAPSGGLARGTRRQSGSGMMNFGRFALVPFTCVVFMALAVGTGPLHAQARADGGRQALEATEIALAEGRYADARARIEGWWQAGEAGRDRTDVQKAIWLRGRLTVEPEAAELLYRRLVVEFPGGAWSDQALIRLSHGARARGEVDVARRYLEILIRDYPGSPHRVEARSGLAQLEGGARPSTTPPATSATGQTTSQAPAPASPPAPAPAPAQGPSRPQAQPPQPTGTFAVQFGAFGQVASAASLSRELEGAGLDVRLVRVDGSPLIRVRLGRFPSRAAAESRAAELRERGFEVMVSADGDREAPVS
ncbi:MAG: hypothetical protein EA350_13885 [Gemmatimonadales bacterium]|nr:MAG: hypothetical protein EA350_13885 [Gemmatimonadales bacterium]